MQTTAIRWNAASASYEDYDNDDDGRFASPKRSKTSYFDPGSHPFSKRQVSDERPLDDCNTPGAFRIQGVRGGADSFSSEEVDEEEETCPSQDDGEVEIRGSIDESAVDPDVILQAQLVEETDEARQMEELRRQVETLQQAREQERRLTIEAIPILEQQQDKFQESAAKKSQPRKSWNMKLKAVDYISAAVILAAMGAVVFAVVHSLTPSSPPPPTTEAPTMAPSIMPNNTLTPNNTVAPTPPVTTAEQTNRYNDIFSLVASLFESDVMAYQSDSESPQAKAVAWMVESGYEIPSRLTVEAGIHFKQLYSLIVFAYSTSIFQWRTSSNWLDLSVHECNWTGVECGDGDQRITKMNFGNNFMAGTIPTEIGKGLSFLRDISIIRNRGLVGTIPTELLNIEALNSLRLRELGLTGTVPIKTSGSLTRLHLSGNRLNGTLPSYMGETLQYLYLYDNQLTGTISGNLLASSNLKEVSLRNNLFTGSIVVQSGKLPLERLNLSKNRLTGPLPTLELHESLKQLILSYNNFTGPVPMVWGNLFNLTGIQLEGTFINGTVPTEVCQLRGKALIDFTADCKSEVSCPTDCCTTCY